MPWPRAMLFGTGLVLVGILAITLFRVVRGWTRAQRQEPIGLDLPVVMLHGIVGFDRIGWWWAGQDYFRGLRRHLSRLGVSATFPRVPMLGSVAERAQALAQHVESLDATRVVVVAHSMGGLDARYAIHALGLDKRIAILVTVGTPHRGTRIADLGQHAVPRLFRWLLSRSGLSTLAVDALTTDAAARFNHQVPDSPSVRYTSVVAHARWTTLLLNPALWLSGWYLSMTDGPSDGLVPTSSQRWGTVIAEIDADHWSQIGWTLRYNTRVLYTEVLRRILTMETNEGHP